MDDQVLRADDAVGLTRAWSGRLSDATGVDEEAIWEWGLIQGVTTGLYLIRHGHRQEGRAFLASAERLL
jgi:streptomycin 6-kinase